MPTDAIELLMSGHETLRALLGELSRTSEAEAARRNQLLARIERELQIHAELEEQIFYPALRAAGGQEENRMFYEAIEAHRAVANLVLPDLKKIDPGSARFSGRAKVMKTLVESHADEEESTMFAAARRLLSEAQLGELGRRLQQRREELA